MSVIAYVPGDLVAEPVVGVWIGVGVAVGLIRFCSIRYESVSNRDIQKMKEDEKAYRGGR